MENNEMTLIVKHVTKSHYERKSDVRNLIAYIAGHGVDKDKNTTAIVNAKGLSLPPHKAAEQILSIQHFLCMKRTRRMYHFIISFPPHYSDQKMVLLFADRISEYIFKKYQVYFAVHNSTDNIHIHLGINAMSYLTAKKIHLSSNDLITFKQIIQQIVNNTASEYSKNERFICVNE